MNRPARRRSSKQQSLTTPFEPTSSTNNNINDINTMDSGHRKIELQSPEDLTYLINNVRRAAAARISEAFPPVEGEGDDELRVRIEKMVDEVHSAPSPASAHYTKKKLTKHPCPPPQYITQTFTLAAPNLSINGFDLDGKTFPAVYLSHSSTTTNSADNNDPSEPQEIIQHHPFDARLRARVEALARDEEDLMRELATLKKTLPAAAAREYGEGFWAGVKADEEGFARAKEATAVDEKRGEMLQAGKGERLADVEGTHRGVVGTLGRLRREMPAVNAKMERARVAGEYVVTER